MTGPGGPRKLLTEPYEGPADPFQAPSEPGLPACAGGSPASQEGVDLLRRRSAAQSVGVALLWFMGSCCL